MSWATVSWVATASSSTVEPRARRALPAGTPVWATTTGRPRRSARDLPFLSGPKPRRDGISRKPVASGQESLIADFALVMTNCSDEPGTLTALFSGALVAGQLPGSPVGAGDFSTSGFRRGCQRPVGRTVGNQ